MISSNLTEYLREESKLRKILLINDCPAASEEYKYLIENTGHSLIGELNQLFELDYLMSKNQPDLVIVNIETNSNYNGFLLAKVAKIEFDSSIFIIYNSNKEHLKKWAQELNPIGIESFDEERFRVKHVA
jgi:response regulator RpfG family c-di-GMP phosphodiesterase